MFQKHTLSERSLVVSGVQVEENFLRRQIHFVLQTKGHTDSKAGIPILEERIRMKRNGFISKEWAWWKKKRSYTYFNKL